jgi:hypothetical protein
MNNLSDIVDQQKPQDPSPSKLKQPEVKVPESIKNLQRRPTEDCRDSIKLTANLVSALGVMSQPEEKEEPCESPTGTLRFDRIHDRLQSLVDVRISSELEHLEKPVMEDIPQIDTNAMTAKGNDTSYGFY